MSVKMKLVCESADVVAEVRERLDREVAHRLVARGLFLDVLRILERGDRRGDAEGVHVVRHPPGGHLLDGGDVADGVADADAGHPVGLRERPRHDDAGRRQRQRNRRLETESVA